MRKTALLLALLLLLSSCGAPVQEPPEPSAAKPPAVPWEGPSGQYILRPASPDEIGQKTELTLAIFADTPYIDARVAAFNSRSEEYEIRIVNYAAEAGSLANARLRLNTELGSGGGPDMVCFPWQDMCYHMDPAYFIEVVSRRYMRGAIDWETGTCDFDNPEFIALLKAAARVKEDRTDSGIDVDNGMNFDSYYAGKEISYFGYPSPDGEGHSGTDEHLRL